MGEELLPVKVYAKNDILDRLICASIRHLPKRKTLEKEAHPAMRPVHPPQFLHYPASRRNNLIASICVNCHRYIAAGDLELLNNVERQHVCVKKPPVSYRPHLVQRRRTA